MKQQIGEFQTNLCSRFDVGWRRPFRNIVTSVMVLGLALFGRTAVPNPTMLQTVIREGFATVSPDRGISGEFGTWTVRYVVGRSGIQEGGGIRVQLPDSWHAGPRNSANRLQASDPTDEHYVSSTCTREGVSVETVVESEGASALVKHAKKSLGGRSERYVFVVRVLVAKGELKEGDSISVVYGDWSQGSPGYRAAAIATKPERVMIAIDNSGDNQFQLLQPSPSIQSLPGDATEMQFHAPSHGIVGQPLELLISLVDKENNPVSRSESIRMRVLSGNAELPERVVLPRDQGFVRFKATPKMAGIMRLRAVTEELSLDAFSNPILVSDTAPEKKIYWGDLHSHSRYSWDGVGNDPFQYARNIAGLDFYALTDHAVAPPSATVTRGLSERSWADYSAQTERHNDPPRFVTLHAYECSFGGPFGHHNVYFRDQPGAFAYPSKVSLPQLWAMLRQGDALTIPHHTGKFPSGVDFSIHNPHFRRNFEIYSGHGLSEAYDPHHPLAFEQSTFTSPSRSLNWPSHAQDAWVRGLELSTIASSDDHRAQPGQPHFGLVAVRASSPTRNNIFQALYDRHTYATTGARIILDFALNGAPMGESATFEGPAESKILVIGTDIIEAVELLKFQAPSKAFEVAKRWEPHALEFRETHRDTAFRPGAIYYVRVLQRKNIRDRIVMAWSSPIWTRLRAEP